MEELFRLMLQRPAIAQDPVNPSIDLTQATAFQAGVRNALQGRQPIEDVGIVSRAYVASALFMGSPTANPYSDKLLKLDTALQKLDSATPKDVRSAIERAFGTTLAKLVADKDFASALANLRDSIVAIKAVQEEHSRDIEGLSRQLRLMELTLRASAEDTYPADTDSLRAALRRTLQLPGKVALKSRLSTSDLVDRQREELAAKQADRVKQVTDLSSRYAALKSAITEMGSVRPEHIVSDPQQQSEQVLPAAELRSQNAAIAQAKFVQSVRETALKSAAIVLQKRGSDAAAQVRLATDQNVLSASIARSGRATFKPRMVAFTLHKDGAATLSDSTKALLQDRKLDPTTVPLDTMTRSLETELTGLTVNLQALAAPAETTSLKRVGNAVVALKEVKYMPWTGVIAQPLSPAPLDGRIPHTKGDVAPSGIADLIVVRQQLVGYEGVDIAHIENVLKGETKQREYVAHDETVTTVTDQTEVTTEDDHELASTTRFEMSKEADETIKEDVQLKAGLKVSGKYGPVVEFSVSADGSYQRTKEEATKSASKYSQEVTDKTTKKLTQRVTQTTTTTVTHETTDTDKHGIDNTNGDGHIRAVYQWINKIYQAQMFNYGLRALFDFMVPEPAAFLIAAMNSAYDSAVTVTKPLPFTITPDQINEGTYGYCVAQYGATDVTPPPSMYKTFAANYQAGPGDSDSVDFVNSGQISLDEGYQAIWASVGMAGNVWEDDAATDVLLGTRSTRFENGAQWWSWSTSLDSEQGTIVWAAKTWKMASVILAIEIKCQRTDKAMQQWKLDTHGKLTTAYKARMQEYEEKLAQLQLQAGVAIQGKNPAANLAAIAAELKKNCISILTDQQFDLFDGINTDPTTSLPQIDIYEAAGEGPYVRFFEQAFEWEHMQWVTYPYFWGRKSQWPERLGYDDPDPAFSDFLKAGYARVTVPARPGFESAIDHFLTFGEVWNGGPLPAVSNPLYLPIADELAARLDQPGTEVPQGDPWKVLVPTELVYLRADDKLPAWEQNANGDWVEA